MNMTILSGSQRSNSESTRVSHIIASRLQERACDVFIHDCANSNLNLWSESTLDSSAWRELRSHLQATDGLVVVSPEWAGMVPPALKNIFLLASGIEFAHKPAYVVGISSGQGGAAPIHELRSTAYKNNKICFVPEHLVLRNVTSFLQDPSLPSDLDKRILGRLDYGLSTLLSYAEALQPVRLKLQEQERRYPHGL